MEVDVVIANGRERLHGNVDEAERDRSGPDGASHVTGCTPSRRRQSRSGQFGMARSKGICHLAVRLRRVSPDSRGWTRQRRGAGFAYVDEAGRRLRVCDVARIKALAIPPAWTEVWICSRPDGRSAGRRHRRRRTPAVPLPPRLARAAGQGQARSRSWCSPRSCRTPGPSSPSTWALDGLPW